MLILFPKLIFFWFMYSLLKTTGQKLQSLFQTFLVLSCEIRSFALVKYREELLVFTLTVRDYLSSYVN